jgi:hypothetical protein
MATLFRLKLFEGPSTPFTPALHRNKTAACDEKVTHLLTSSLTLQPWRKFFRCEGHAMGTSNWTNSLRRTVVGYFADGEDAHRAINELLEQGFRASEIGAAFHSEAAAAGNAGALGDMEMHPATGPNAPDAGSTVSGAASDTSAVTPAGLSTGGGTATSGANRPGPVPGSQIPSSLPSTLPHTIHSTIPSTLHPERTAPVADNYPATGSFHETRKNEGPDWWDKLKSVFGGSESSTSERDREAAVADKTTTNFGTGEGHLGAYPDYDYAYSSAAFESAFFGMGIPADHARQLSGRIRRGGAIVTVDAGALNANAEQILEHNHGSVRYDTANSAPSLNSENARLNDESRVQLFGRVQGVYPGYVSSSGSATRKAS